MQQIVPDLLKVVPRVNREEYLDVAVVRDVIGTAMEIPGLKEKLQFPERTQELFTAAQYAYKLDLSLIHISLNNMEVILTAAECYAREGGTENLAEAARLYNLLRDHRIENNVHVTFANADEALAVSYTHLSIEVKLFSSSPLPS